MTDSNSVDVATGASDLGQTFNERAGEPNVTSERDTGVGATAQAEIEVIQQAENALAQHDDRWRELSDRLSNRPMAAPSMDMDGMSQRSVTREYTAYREEWSAQRDAIETGAIRDAVDVRANGTTLTNEFSASSGQESPEPAPNPEPAPITQNDEPTADAPDQFQREFAAVAPDMSRTNDR